MNDRDLLRRAAVTTMRWNFRLWGFGEAIALRGLLASAPVLNDETLNGFVYGLMRGWVGRGVARSNEDHVAPGRELLAVWERERDPVLLDAARSLAALNASFPKGATGARCHRPDTPGWRHQIWVDCMDIDGPFLVRLAAATGEDRYFDQAAEELLGYARALQDEGGGLFRHGHEKYAGRNGAHWARGNGWALMGLADSLEILPPEHPAAAELRQRLASLVAALAARQDEGGLWHTVLTDDATYLETTLAAMVACTLPVAIGHGLVDPRFAAMAGAARAAMLAHVDADGALALVSDATPVGEHRGYATRPFGIFPWGQGPLLLTLARSDA
ncbi:glycoside hydrolase family 88 protein [Sphingomonas sp.]|uniref:glycoside hydrolase family 88 protein n=1 Tax=Sphingomonas sp. TaxID=28214 RepID=UPI003D6CE4D8